PRRGDKCSGSPCHCRREWPWPLRRLRRVVTPRASSVALCYLSPNSLRQIPDDASIPHEKQQFQRCDALDQLIQLDGNVQPCGNCPQPLRPQPPGPKAVGFCESESRVRDRPGRKQQEPRVGQLVSGLNQNTRVLAGWIEVEMANDFFRDVLNIV